MIKRYPLEGLQLGPREPQATTQSAAMVVSFASPLLLVGMGHSVMPFPPREYSCYLKLRAENSTRITVGWVH